MPAEQDHDIARGHPTLGEAGRHPDRHAAELLEGHLAVVEDQRRLVRVLVDARREVAPQVAFAPVALGVVAIGLRLERQRRLGHGSLLRNRFLK
jgi:hypothetical protein